MIQLLLLLACLAQTPQVCSAPALPIPKGGNPSVVIGLCPNGNQPNTSGQGNCVQPPTLAFGKQGTSTTSPALTVNVTNTGTATASFSPGPSLGGANSADFSLTNNCAATLAANAQCTVTVTFTPTQAAGTNEAAILTINDNGLSGPHTIGLSGTSATVTTLNSCQTITTTANYQLTANVSATSSCFPVQAASVDLNLNGFTVTYSSNDTTKCNFGVYAGTASDNNLKSGGCGFGNPTGGTSWNNLTVHNGTVTEGSCIDLSDANIGSSPIYVGSGSGSGVSVFNVTFNPCSDSASPISSNGNANSWVIHDNFVNSRVVTAVKRSVFEGVAFVCSNCGGQTGTAAHFYNNVIVGQPQGGIMFNQPGAEFDHNFVKHGIPTALPPFPSSFSTNFCNFSGGGDPYTNAAGTLPANAGSSCTNDFGIYARHNNQNVHDNAVQTTAGRGLFIGAAVSGAFLQNNVVINEQEQAINSEYQGCELDGGYGIQLDDNPNTQTIQNNTVTVTSGPCRGAALRVTDSEALTNISQNNTYTAKRSASPNNCTPGIGVANSNLNCAFAWAFDAPTAFKSVSDTFIGDSAILYADVDRPSVQSDIEIVTPTFIAGTANPDPNFHTFIDRICGSGCASRTPLTVVNITDATFGTGTSATDTDFPATAGQINIFIKWTQTVTVKRASDGSVVNAATVTFTDTQGTNYTGTTGSNGIVAIAVPQWRDNNDTQADQHESRNPYQRQVTATGCMTNTVTGLTISATGSVTVTMAGC